jgi:hypothetical protein
MSMVAYEASSDSTRSCNGVRDSRERCRCPSMTLRSARGSSVGRFGEPPQLVASSLGATPHRDVCASACSYRRLERLQRRDWDDRFESGIDLPSEHLSGRGGVGALIPGTSARVSPRDGLRRSDERSRAPGRYLPREDLCAPREVGRLERGDHPTTRAVVAPRAIPGLPGEAWSVEFPMKQSGRGTGRLEEGD